MRTNRRWFLAGAISVILPLIFTVYARGDRDREEAKFSWDLVHLTSFMPVTINAGGNASALANDLSKITLMGSGTFQVGDADEVTGGGTWITFSPTGAETGRGTYRVTRLIRFELAPGAETPTTIDNIADKETAHSGLAAFAIRYSDGARGVLIVSCHLTSGTPDSIFEGVTASKGFVDFWSRVAPVAGVDSNRTAFHSLPEDEDRDRN